MTQAAKRTTREMVATKGDAANSAPLLQMKDWAQVFGYKKAEDHKEVEWGKFPCARNSLTYRAMMETPAGRDAYCVFIAIWRLVTRYKTRGVLAIDGRPITWADIYRDTSLPKKTILGGFDYLLRTARWLEPSQSSIGPSTVDLKSPAGGLPTPFPLACAKSESESSSGSSPPVPDSRDGLLPPRAQISGRWDGYTMGRILAAYPKQTKKAPALREISAALDVLWARPEIGDKAPEWLEGRVKAYTAAVVGKPRQYVPDPPRWFADGRYDDDDAAWVADSRDSDAPTSKVSKEKF